MPAKTTIKPRYKAYVGRTFLLRQHRTIQVKSTNGRSLSLSALDIGEAVLILDENNSLVLVPTEKFGHVWMPKFYLHFEIDNEGFDKVDNVVELVNRLTAVAAKVENEEQKKELQEIITGLRAFADTINPSCHDE